MDGQGGMGRPVWIIFTWELCIYFFPRVEGGNRGRGGNYVDGDAAGLLSRDTAMDGSDWGSVDEVCISIYSDCWVCLCVQFNVLFASGGSR